MNNVNVKDLVDKMAELINNKYLENSKRNMGTGPFDKLQFLEANAVGQIGESFVKDTYKKLGINVKNRDNIHDEYDVLIDDIKIEVKTARLGRNNTFQFNGINPSYNNQYIILLGISNTTLYYRIVKHSDLEWVHHGNRGWYCHIDDSLRKLAPMNPNNNVNFKLTLNCRYLYEIDDDFSNVLIKMSRGEY